MPEYYRQPSEFIYLTGKAKWARLDRPDDKFANPPVWSIQLYMDDKTYQEFSKIKEEKGLLNVIKKDDDGYNVLLKRPTSKLMRGKLVPFSAPEVLEQDGKTPLRSALVGNGSDVTCKVEMYSYNKPTGGKGHAIRLMSVRVDNLIPYNAQRDFEPDSQAERNVRGFDQQPANEPRNPF